LKNDPVEFTKVAPKSFAAVRELQDLLLSRFRSTHPDANAEPRGLTAEESLDWYLRPRDA
jgi:hypothetical protein